MARTAQSQTVGMALSGDKELQAAVNDIIANTRDLREPWQRFYRPAFHRAMEQTFSTRQSGTWRPLTKQYADWKKDHGGGQLMVLTSDLKDSLTGETGESFFRPRERDMEIGSTNMPTNTPKGRMVVWAQSTAMKYHIREAATEHVAWYGQKWGRHGV